MVGVVDGAGSSGLGEEAGGVLVLVRHGQTEWNASGRFSGWADVGLSAAGRREAQAMGQLLAEHDFYPAEAFTSRLQRAQSTLEIILEHLGGRRDRPATTRHRPEDTIDLDPRMAAPCSS